MKDKNSRLQLQRFGSYDKLVRTVAHSFIHLQRSRNRDINRQICGPFNEEKWYKENYDASPEWCGEPTNQRVIREEYNAKQRELSIIIPVKGRSQHLRATLNSFKKALHACGTNADMIQVTVAEIDVEPKNQEIARELADSYLFIKSKVFNKSLIMNRAADMFDASLFLFHDVDLIVESCWLQNVLSFAVAAGEQCNLTWVSQPIHERKIFYVDEKLTSKVFAGEVEADDLNKHQASLMVQPTWYQGNYPPGGSILVGRDLFFAVQGYDPELFWGYSPEDKFFLDTCVALSGGRFFIPQTPVGNVYHLYHPISELSNEAYEHMVFARDISLHPACRNLYLWNKHVLSVWKEPQNTQPKLVDILLDTGQTYSNSHPALNNLCQNMAEYFDITDKGKNEHGENHCEVKWRDVADWPIGDNNE